MLPGLGDKVSKDDVKKRYIKAVGKAILKVMAKMGISTYQSYCGAQIFDAVGLRSPFVERYFTGTHTQVEGVGLREIARETVERHRSAFGDVPVLENALEVGGEYAFRVRGEAHMWRPGTVADLQHSVRGADTNDAMAGKIPPKYRDFAKSINDQSEQLMTLRGMFRIRSAESMGRKPVPIEEVEPAKDIVKRFSTGAMSFGSISREAHTTLAIAMNRIGGKSNTGEGGEESDRFKPLPNGDSMRSAIKQVASGRFGVTTEYLINSDMIQIKMAQGAKPGEGGQLPGSQGRCDHRQGAPLDAGRRPHLAAAAPRHLLDRGSGAAHLRSEERQSARRHLGEARLRSRRRHGRRGRRQGARRSRHHFGLRGRHRRLAADLHQARRLPLGNRPCRNAPDARRQQTARPHRRAGRWRLAHRPRRRRRRAARRG